MRRNFSLFLLVFLVIVPVHCKAQIVELGIDRVFQEPYNTILKGKKIGLITNQTGINSKLQTTADLFFTKQKEVGYSLQALFGPEHGIYGDFYAGASVASTTFNTTIPIFSLHGQTRRPTDEMLKNISLLVFDIQDIGSRSYTYISTLFYCMEEAAKRKIAVMVLDRPNPINGLTVDGPMLETEFRSFLGYANTAYCHGMTTGELARFFNKEYKINCSLYVVPMKGWRRAMSFDQTQLTWIPTSPNIPEKDSPCFYPATGILGEMNFVSIGIGYTLPFKLVGAPWIDAKRFTKALNSYVLNYALAGVWFHEMRFQPFMYRFAAKPCQAALVVVTNKTQFLPVTTQYLIMSVLKELYPEQTMAALQALEKDPKNFYKVCGTKAVHQILTKEKKPFDKLVAIHKAERAAFMKVRSGYLLPEYQ